MAQQHISTGTAPAGVDGDTVRSAMEKAEANFNEIYSAFDEAYISGLKMTWVNATSISVSSGAAWIPGYGQIVQNNSALTLSGISLTASMWHHVYLYLDSGAPAVECVSTAPDTPYNGTARAKTGDTTRRYVGSVLADSSGNVYKFKMNGDSISWNNSIANAPFLVLSAGRATTPTNVSCSGAVPVTAIQAKIILANVATGADAPIGASDMTGTLSSTNYLQYLSAGVQTTDDVSLDGSRSFNYMLTATVSTGGLFARIAGYDFER